MGGRLLPDLGLPAAQFMYEDAAGRRLTLYIRKETGLNNTSFQFAERDGLGAFYWIDRPLAYALAGRLSREELMSSPTPSTPSSSSGSEAVGLSISRRLAQISCLAPRRSTQPATAGRTAYRPCSLYQGCGLPGTLTRSV